MLEPLDRYRRDSTLFQFTTRRLRDFINPSHLLIQIDDKVKFAKLVEPLEGNYSPNNGRPAIHPEVLVRALLISALYNITSFRRLCLAISENIAFRWFCFLTIDDEVFDHSTISYFIERIGREGFKALFQGFNQELLRLGMLSPKMYADSTLVKADVSSQNLPPSEMTVKEFQEKAIQENGLFVVREIGNKDDANTKGQAKYYQDCRGQLALSPVDLDARWLTHSSSKPAELCYLENTIVDDGGFILARTASHASEADWRVIPKLLEEVPIKPDSLTADSSYSAGELRKHLRDQEITHYIPTRSKQESELAVKHGFEYHEGYLICPEGKKLRRTAFIPRENTFRYNASQKDCRICPRKAVCLPPSQQKRRCIKLSVYYTEFERARDVNKTLAYSEAIRKRLSIIEGVFAYQDRLGWARCKLRGLWKVDCEGFLASLTHNILKALRKSRTIVSTLVAVAKQTMEMEMLST
jgi:transposase